MATAYMSGYSARRRGLTLVEMLVVLAIVAILAGILFPVFARVREAGHNAVCLANLKQLALGMTLYCNDHNGYFPEAWPGNILKQETPQPDQAKPGGKYLTNIGKDDGHFVTWMDALFPYVRSTGVFECPSVEHNELISYGLSSCLNGQQGDDYKGGRGVRPASMNRVRRPSEIVMLFDHNRAAMLEADPFFLGGVARGVGEEDNALFLHDNGINVAYVDGHVKRMPRETLSALPSGSAARDDRAWDAFLP